MWYAWNKEKKSQRFILNVTWDVMLKNTVVDQRVNNKVYLRDGGLSLM